MCDCGVYLKLCLLVCILLCMCIWCVFIELGIDCILYSCCCGGLCGGVVYMFSWTFLECYFHVGMCLVFTSVSLLCEMLWLVYCLLVWWLRLLCVFLWFLCLWKWSCMWYGCLWHLYRCVLSLLGFVALSSLFGGRIMTVC